MSVVDRVSALSSPLYQIERKWHYFRNMSLAWHTDYNDIVVLSCFPLQKKTASEKIAKKSWTVFGSSLITVRTAQLLRLVRIECFLSIRRRKPQQFPLSLNCVLPIYLQAKCPN